MDEPRPHVQRKIIAWLATGETGLSSECMAFWLGWKVKAERPNAPADPDDLNRCLKLLRDVPELQDIVHRMRTVSNEWKAIMGKWEMVTSMFVNEVGIDWKKAKSAPATYNLMREIYGDAP